VGLTTRQIDALDDRIDEFIAAEYEAREAIVEEYYDKFKTSLDKYLDVEVKTVSSPSATLDRSDTLLDYSPPLVWKNQIGSGGIRS
jgi:hypothetical protein